MENEDEAKDWLESATEAMYTAFNRSNFQQEIFELYHDLNYIWYSSNVY